MSKFQSSNISKEDSAEVHNKDGGGLEEFGGRLVSESDSRGSLILLSGKKGRGRRGEGWSEKEGGRRMERWGKEKGGREERKEGAGYKEEKRRRKEGGG